MFAQGNAGWVGPRGTQTLLCFENFFTLYYLCNPLSLANFSSPNEQENVATNFQSVWLTWQLSLKKPKMAVEKTWRPTSRNQRDPVPIEYVAIGAKMKPILTIKFMGSKIPTF